jgi:hypothetical protein
MPSIADLIRFLILESTAGHSLLLRGFKGLFRKIFPPKNWEKRVFDIDYSHFCRKNSIIAENW